MEPPAASIISIIVKNFAIIILVFLLTIPNIIQRTCWESKNNIFSFSHESRHQAMFLKVIRTQRQWEMMSLDNWSQGQLSNSSLSTRSISSNTDYHWLTLEKAASSRLNLFTPFIRWIKVINSSDDILHHFLLLFVLQRFSIY